MILFLSVKREFLNVIQLFTEIKVNVVYDETKTKHLVKVVYYNV
jgi:hypothetical protein